VLEFRYKQRTIRVDIILDSVEDFDYGTPDASYPFRVLSLHKLIEHYFCLTDMKNLKTKDQTSKYLGGIQHLIKRQKLTTQFAVKLPEKFRDLFCLLVKWHEESLSHPFKGDEDEDEESDEDEAGNESPQSKEAEFTIFFFVVFYSKAWVCVKQRYTSLLTYPD